MSEGADVGPPGGWMTIGPTEWWARVDMWFWIAGPTLILILISFVPVELFTLQLGLGFVNALLIRAGVIVAVLALSVAVFVAINPTLRIHRERGLLRFRGHTLRFGDIDTVRLLDDGSHLPSGRNVPSGQASVIWIGRADGPKVPIAVSYGGKAALEPDEQAALLDLIERSGIRLPESQYDPSGRFAKYNFPHHLDKSAAQKAIRGLRQATAD